MWSKRNSDSADAESAAGNVEGRAQLLLAQVTREALREQRLRRRWGIFFKFLTFGYLLAIVLIVVDIGEPEELVDGQHTALVDLQGVISASADASSENLVDALQRAFEHKKTKGVVLRINSPGGSPVQSGIVHDEILRLRKANPEKQFHVVVEDICASGGYFVASAADRIYVNRASIVGSIGVLIDGFGFTGAMDKLGVERRLLTAGENKGFLDPFSPQEGRQRAHAQVLLDDIHRQFIEVVRKGRGSRLKDNPDVFSGLMWTGERSIEMGLADELGTVESVARDVIEAERIVDFSVKPGFGERLARRFGAGLGESLAAVLSGQLIR
ncbi:MAG TPA: S49 family peptidase [Rhodocyclaceae bacterium]